ncbi:hypothetical protein [Nannocystis pusilla]|uniref:hypothetical protein n=1 Tax=Nannocystis pusilla TaxID=889268 RepID=UPI003DA21B8A
MARSSNVGDDPERPLQRRAGAGGVALAVAQLRLEHVQVLGHARRQRPAALARRVDERDVLDEPVRLRVAALDRSQRLVDRPLAQVQPRLRDERPGPLVGDPPRPRLAPLFVVEQRELPLVLRQALARQLQQGQPRGARERVLQVIAPDDLGRRVRLRPQLRQRREVSRDLLRVVPALLDQRVGQRLEHQRVRLVLRVLAGERAALIDPRRELRQLRRRLSGLLDLSPLRQRDRRSLVDLDRRGRRCLRRRLLRRRRGLDRDDRRDRGLGLAYLLGGAGDGEKQEPWEQGTWWELHGEWTSMDGESDAGECGEGPLSKVGAEPFRVVSAAVSRPRVPLVRQPGNRAGAA